MKKQNCKWFKKLLGGYLDNEIDSTTRKKIDEHLSECESCQAEFNILKEVNSVSKGSLYLEPSEDYWESIVPRVRSKIEEEIKETAWERFTRFFGEFFGYNNLARNVAGAAAAAVIIVFIVKITNQQLEFISQKPKETEKMEVSEKIEIPQEERHRAEPVETPSLKEPEEKSEEPSAQKPPKVISADISEEKRTVPKEEPKESISEVKETEKIETPLKVEISPEEKITLKKDEAVALATKEEIQSVTTTIKEEGKLEEKTEKFETAVVVKPLEEKEVPPAETIISEDDKVLERGNILKYEEKPGIIIPQKQKEDIFSKTIRRSFVDKGASLRNGFVESEQPRRLERTEIPITEELYPNILDKLPDIPSPFTAEDGTEIVVAFLKDKKYALIPVTVENGEPMNYNKNQWGKGNQLEVNVRDFPTLARTGLHSEIELEQTKMITSKSIAEITEIGRPGRASIAGFLSHDEDIITVLKGDNRLVKKLELTHPQFTKPLFNVFNLILKHLEYYKDNIRPWEDISYILYNGRKIYLEWGGEKGWQESIFNDEILGYYQINIWRELSKEEKAFLDKKYSHLKPEQMSELIKRLSHIHTGEMVPYYIMRYGFYEGHTDYRTDPVAISFIFGLRNLEEIENAIKGNLYKTLTEPFTEDNISTID